MAKGSGQKSCTGDFVIPLTLCVYTGFYAFDASEALSKPIFHKDYE